MNHHILRSTPATLEIQVTTAGDLVDLDALPTLVLTDGAGDTVSSGAVTHPGVGIYRSVLPGQDDLKVLDAAWSGDLSAVPLTLHQSYEIVGNLLFTEVEARTEPIVGSQPALADDTRYSDARIAHWRAVISEAFEHRMVRGVVRRYCRARFAGLYSPLRIDQGYPVLVNGTTLERPGKSWDISRIISATHDGITVDPAELEVIDDRVHWVGNGNSWTPPLADESPLNITLEWEYGPDPVWAEAHQRALDLLLANAAPKGFPSSATSVSTEDGTFRITNFPVAVEEFLKRHNYR